MNAIDLCLDDFTASKEREELMHKQKQTDQVLGDKMEEMLPTSD